MPPGDLAAVQRRRWMPTAAVQGFQMAVHAGVVGPLLRADGFQRLRSLSAGSGGSRRWRE